VVFLCGLILNACGPKSPFPFSDPGPYDFGTKMNIKFTDESRNQEINLYIWYPAVLAEGEESGRYNVDAAVDTSEAPYPVILMSAKGGTYLGPHLATHGFVVIGIDGQDSQDHLGNWLIDYPLDQVFALKQVTSNSVDGLEGMMEADNAGATGYSFGGYNSMVLGGARINPEHYLNKCAEAESDDPFVESWWIDYECNMEGGWDSFVSNAGSQITTSSDGLWQPITDSRIQAVAPLVPEGAWLFGEKGLAEVDMPVMISAAAKDNINPYQLEAVFLYEKLPAADKSMVTFIDQDHMMLTYDESAPIIKHFLVAFFGFHLNGREEYAKYFSEDYISKQEDLAWGVYED